MAKDSLLNIILNIVKQGSGDKDAKDGMADLEKQLGDTTTSLLGSVVGFTTLGGAIYAGIAALKADVEAAADVETAYTQLNATLESTGRQGEVTADGLDKIAASPLFTTAQIDQAANALARFMDIPSDQLGPDLTIIENMAEGLGESLPQAAQTFGQAMETGRTRGLGFSRELQNQISLLMTAGDIQQADAIILDQLSQKYSGQAAAALDTFNGKQQEVKVAFQELDAEIGDHFLPFLKGTEDVILSSVEGWTKFIDVVSENKAITDAAWALQNAAQATENYRVQRNVLQQQYIDMAVTQANETKGIADYSLQLENNAGMQELWALGITESADGLVGYGNNLQTVTTYNNAYTDAIKNGSSAAAAQKIALDAVNQSLVTQQKALEDQDSWEQMYTNAKTAADQTSQVMKLLGGDIQGLGADGAAVWDGFLSATGQISPAAAKQFVDIQNDYATVKKMLADGISVDIVVNWLESVTWAQANSPTMSPNPGSTQKPVTSTPNPWAEGKPQAAGGDYLVNEPTMFIAGEAGPERATFTPLGGGGGGGLVTNNFYISGAGDPKAVAREVVNLLGAHMSLQGARTRI